MSNSSEHYSSANHHVVRGCEVFVGGLPRTLTEEKIREIFSTCGEILEIRLIKDQKGSLKGYCFVRFATKAAADKAVKEKAGLLIDGKKIGVLPSVEQDTLFMGNLYKGWTADEFSILVRQVFPDVVSVDLAAHFSSGESPPGQKKQNRGFAFVKFSSHAAAARAHRAGSSPEFQLGGKVHPAVDWAEEDPEVNPEELAKVKIAFIRNLPGGADENFLKELFIHIGQVEKVVISNKMRSPVGFVHFAERSELDDAIREMNGKTIQGPNGGPPFKLSIEVARPMDKSKKRARQDSQSKQPNKVSVHSKLVTSDPAFSAFASPKDTTEQEAVNDPYEAAVVLLPVAVKERLLRILRLGIATRHDIDIQCLKSLNELPESRAIFVLDQFMLSGADTNNKGAYLTTLISKNQVDKSGLYGLSSSLSRTKEMPIKDSELSSFSTRARLPAFDSISSHVGLSATRSDDHASQYSYMYSDYPSSIRASDFPLSSRASDYPLSSRASDYPLSSRTSDYPLSSRTSDYPLSSQATFGRLQVASPASVHLTLGPSMPYREIGLDTYLASGDRQRVDSHLTTTANRQQVDSRVTTAANRQQIDSRLNTAADHQQIDSHLTTASNRPPMRFDPFTGEPYKFDPFTGEPIRPESPHRHYRSPY